MRRHRVKPSGCMFAKLRTVSKGQKLIALLAFDNELTKPRLERPQTLLFSCQLLLPHQHLALMLHLELAQLFLLPAQLVFLESRRLGGNVFGSDVFLAWSWEWRDEDGQAMVASS